MTVIGQAELDIRAVGAHFKQDVEQQVKPGMASAGREAEKTARGMSSSFGAVWRTFGAQSQGALGPVSAVVSQIQEAVASISRNSSLAAKGLAAGAVGAGLGVGLQALGSGEVAAQQQLQMSIENLGKSYDDYDGRVEKTIKTGERHGHTAEETMRVLNQLTIATKDPAKALADYDVILNMAAVRHVPLQTAARMLSMVYAGSSRALKSFGIDLTAGTKALAAQKTATDAHATATTDLKKARQNLLDVEARIGASRQGHKASADQLASAQARVASAEAAVATARFKHGQASPQAAAAEDRLVAAEARLNKVRGEGTGQTKLTVAQQIELRKAHEAVADAEDKVKRSAADMATAHKQAAGAVTSADDAVKILAERVKGQADPAMNTFSGHLHAYWATAEDDLARFGTKWGGTVTAISTGVLGISSIVGGGQAIWKRFAGSASDAAAAVEGDMAKIETSGRMSMGRLAGAVGGVALAIGTLAVAKATAHDGAKGAAATTLMGAVSGAVIGLSVGGPLGGAIGGAVGALAGLAAHFRDSGHAASDMAGDVKNLATELESGLSADKLSVGEATTSVISSYLTKNGGVAQTFAKYGFSMKDLVEYLQSGGKSGLTGTKLGAAMQGGFNASGKVVYSPGVADAQKALSAMLAAFQQAMAVAGAVQTVNTLPATPARPTWAPATHAAHAAAAAAAAHRNHLANTPTAAQLTSMHGTLLQIQTNTGHGTNPGKPVHVAALPGGRYRFGNSPELATL